MPFSQKQKKISRIFRKKNLVHLKMSRSGYKWKKKLCLLRSIDLLQRLLVCTIDISDEEQSQGKKKTCSADCNTQGDVSPNKEPGCH
jgi:hypothetical protein